MENDVGSAAARKKVVRGFSFLLFVIAGLIFLLAAATRKVEGPYFQILLSIGGVMLGLAAQRWLNISAMLRNVVEEDRAFQTEQARMGELGRMATDMGIRKLSSRWGALASAIDDGSEIRQRLGEDTAPRNWYFLTTNPTGFLDKGWMRDVIFPAIWRGIRIKWAYIPLAVGQQGPIDRTKQVFWDVQSAHPSPNLEERLRSASQGLAVHEADLIHSAELIKAHVLREMGRIESDFFEIYASELMHPFLGFLSVVPLEKAPAGFAIIQPYQIYGHGNRRWGMYLESPGEVFEQYALSVLTHFSDGVTRGYLRLVWPQDVDSDQSSVRDKV
jgi:hypothetical protein